jgi:hypothetical protein
MNRALVGQALRLIGLVVGATVVALLVLEGAASVAYSIYLLAFDDNAFMREEQAHAEYDDLLGWVNRPDLHLPDLYGPGRSFRSNGQRFRASRDYPPDPPAGVSRVICSGDSFTMGHSVGDDDTWCARLASTVPNVETVNMGMAAYGIDQAFLWYRRDGAALRHDLQILAFITNDFERMAYDHFGGYPKSYLKVTDGRLEVANVPVPRRFSAMPQLQRRQRAALNLSVIRHSLSALRRLGIQPGNAGPAVLEEADVRAAASRVFEDLRDLNAAKGSRLVLVYLPESGDRTNPDTDRWRAFVASEAGRLDVPFIDLVETFRALPADAAQQFFVIPYRRSHYNEGGNAWVARELRARLFAPRVSAR